MLFFEELEKKLVITFRTDRKLKQEELALEYAKFLQLFKNELISISFDLNTISNSDTNEVAFIIAGIELCKSKGIDFDFKNCSADMEEFFKKIGYLGKNIPAIKREKFYNIKPIFISAREASYRFYKDLIAFVGFIGEIASVIWFLLKNPKKIQYREMLYYMEKTGADGVPIISLMCFLMGAIIGYQGVVQMGRFGLSIFVANLVGLSIVKELGVLMVAVICIGRAGSAFAAEIGTMKVAEEIDAMTTMGLRVSRFLVLPKLIALVLVMPLLTLIGDITGIIGGMYVSVLKSGITPMQYYDRTLTAITPSDFFEGVIKSVVFAVIIAIVGCLRGLQADNDAKGVGKASTSAVVTAVFLIVIADAILTTFFN